MSSPPPNSSKQGDRPSRRPNFWIGGNWAWLVIIAVALSVVLFTRAGSRAVEYGVFWNLLNDEKENRKVKRVVFRDAERMEITLAEDSLKDPEEGGLSSRYREKIKTIRFEVKIPSEDKDLLPKLRELAGQDRLQLLREEEPFAGLGTLILFLLPMILFIAFFFFVLPKMRDPMGGGFLNNYIRSPAKKYEKGKTRVTFDDVAGMENAKGELKEIVEFLKSPEKFSRLGATVPKGVLLVGSPGTGKTLLAKAVAGEAGVPFYSINGSEFIQMFVGVGASRVRDMFKTAKENSPCILFIDEIDAVGRMRGAGVGGGSDEREQTLNQILSEMDGFQPSQTVIVVAATNRPDVLDSALLRPGRFDRHITVDRPTWQGRMGILKVHTRNKPLADDVDLEDVARATVGMTGADLRNLCNEAALLATREGKDRVDRSDFHRASDRVLIGPKREEVLTQEDKRRTAYHEMGHALVTWLMPGADKPQKVSIIPRGQSLGVNLTMPDEDRFHYGRDHFEKRLVMTLAGRAADKLIYGQPYSGAESDLKQATRLARLMVAHWGMSDRVGPMAFRVGEEHLFLGKEIQESRDFSEGTAQIIDQEISRLLREADEKAMDLLSKNRNYLEAVTDELVLKEEMLRVEIDEVLRSKGMDVPPPKPRADSTPAVTVPAPAPVEAPAPPTPPTANA
ncbi:MAG: ATP-dependent zinc metalloprotease FtsH [Planctomycetota bacterium]|nr:MAG: ATP-dependent zinc metalloprotease FtsH [Planctomycetota bacterium]